MKLLKTTVAATALCLSMSTAWADGLSARINTDRVATGDSLQLVLTADGPGAATPDLAPLAQDFDVLGTSQSSQTQIVNGHRSQSTSWIVTLAPQATGTVTIPSIQAGALSSDPLTVNVVDASQLPKLQGTTGIALSATVEDGTHYRFQEIPLTVRIETAQPLQSAELIAPAGNFELTPTGQDRQSRITRNGQPVTVVERDYLLRPDSTGALTIPPFTLKGAVNDPNARHNASASPFGSRFNGRDPFAMMDQMMARMGGMRRMSSPFDAMFNTGTPFVARSDAMTLDVLDNPNGAGSDWFLPAKAVELSSEWLPASPSFREGEAVTRKVSVLALGARPEQLPDLTFSDPAGARIYLDDVETDMIETPQGTMARRDFTLSVVPTQGGAVTLPEVAVEWLDTATSEVKTATLAAQEILVDGTPPAAAPQTAAVDVQQTAAEPDTGLTSDQRRFLGLLVAALLIAMGAAAIAHRRKVWSDQSPDSPFRQKSDTLRSLRKAASAGDFKAFYAGLLELRAESAAPERTRIEEAIARLDRETYAPTGAGDPVDLNALMKGLDVRHSAKDSRGLWRRRDALPSLYPQT